MSNPRRTTRSQLAIPDFHLQLSRSPLKDARTALRNNVPTTPPPTFTPDTVSDDDSNKPSKRAVSPAKDAISPAWKKPRYSLSDHESERPLEHMPSHKPRSSSSVPLRFADSLQAIRRAKSVPPSTSGLNSPRPKLEPLRIHIPSPKPSSQTFFTSGDSLHISPPPHVPTPQTNRRSPVSTPTDMILSPVQPSSPLTPPPTSSDRISSDTPMPDAGPEPTTSDSNEKSEQEAGTSEHVLPPLPRTPSASRLPRPSMAPPPTVGRSKDDVERKKAPSVRTRGAKRPNATRQIPLGGRMTRSASLRATQAKKNAGGGVVGEDASAAPPAAGPSTAKAAITATPGKGKSNTAPRTTPKRPFSFSFAQPTSSSAARIRPPSPDKGKARALDPSAPTQSSQRNHASISSLSSLSVALQRLGLPAPSRPNTSLGFNPDKSDTDDVPIAGTTDTERSSEAATTSTSSIPRPVTANKPRPPVSMPARSFSSLDIRSKPLESMPVVMGPPNAGGGTKGLPIAETPAKRINLQSGIITGKPKGLPSFVNRTAAQRNAAGPSNRPKIFGVGGLGSQMGRNRVAMKASQKSSLPTVEGSPVKGGTTMEPAPPGEKIAALQLPIDIAEDIPQNGGAAAHQSAEEQPNSTIVASTSSAAQATSSASPILTSSSLSQSMSVPQTPQAEAPTTLDISSVPTKRRISPRTINANKANGAATAPSALTRGGGRGIHVARARSEAPPVTQSPGHSAALLVLKDCVIFVDVRTDEGDDAGALFVDMLKGLGARILTRVGQSCTHIVYKNGLMSTVTRYRLLDEPRPSIVGIAWVVECAEQRIRADETKFLVDVEGLHVAGSSKRRRSMLPKNFAESPTTGETANRTPLPGEGLHAPLGDRSVEVAASPADVAQDSTPGSSESRPGVSSVAPLEKARRRRSEMFFGVPAS